MTLQDDRKGRFENMRSLIGKKSEFCQHRGIREIGQDFDKDGNAVRLVRCQGCGLLIRENMNIEHTMVWR